MKALSFPVVPRPAVSVLMATYGGWQWVEKSLRALLENTEPCYEVIVVDNASPDGLADRLDEDVGNIRLIRNRVNRGFGPANNQAADLATGRALVLLNSDAFVHPGWLPPLLETLETDPTVAAVGPKILNPDGTLQEAGCLLSRSGRPQFYGFGDDPAKPEYNVPRVVDYSSASCLLVRRRAFHDVGGFDPLFAPFYFEDVDLGLTFAARGWKTLYEPRSVVTHLRGASETEKEAAIQGWSHNETAFEARWLSFLAPYPRFAPLGGNRDLLLEARDLPACGGRSAHQGNGEP